jgi:hypothetical protein
MTERSIPKNPALFNHLLIRIAIPCRWMPARTVALPLDGQHHWAALEKKSQ